MKIYNLFPLLAGPLKDWPEHLERAAGMGFDWVFVNPIQVSGKSGSLYSIKDYFAINPILLDPASKDTPETQVRKLIKAAEKLGQRLMIDLVINHCAYDSELLTSHPEWFVRQGNSIAHPSCTHEGQEVVWRDLALFNHQNSKDQEGLYQYCLKIVKYLLDLGFKGLRCDAAYQLPQQFWARLITDVRKQYPDTLFAAETLGCSPEQTKETARSGFDYIFNSSKWWDFGSPWLLAQYHLTRDTVPSISFPESHDTARLFAETHGNINALKQRYLFSALFSAGVMMPMGFEYGFSKPLHVVETRPSDWETTGIDLTGFIRDVNAVKEKYPVFSQESITEVLGHDSNPEVMVMWKSSANGKSQALLILSKDPWNRQNFRSDNLYRFVQTPPPLLDVSPEWPMEYLPSPFEYELHPGMGRILVSG